MKPFLFKILVLACLFAKALIIKESLSTGAKILNDEDQFYRQRGSNRYCQLAKDNAYELFNNAPEKHYSRLFCSLGAKRSMILFINGLALDMFSYYHRQRMIAADSAHRFGHLYAMKHYGILDSGPTFSNMATGRVANKYEDSILGVDNIFAQLKESGFRIAAHGYNYPVKEMVGTEYFESYIESDEALTSSLCPGFLNIYKIYNKHKDDTDMGLVNSKLEMLQTFQKYLVDYKRDLSWNKSMVQDCLQTRVEKRRFLY